MAYNEALRPGEQDLKINRPKFKPEVEILLPNANNGVQRIRIPMHNLGHAKISL